MDDIALRKLIKSVVMHFRTKGRNITLKNETTKIEQNKLFMSELQNKYSSMVNSEYKIKCDFNFSPTTKLEGTLDYVFSTGLDPLGKVFYKDGRVFRGIFPNKVEHCKNLFNSGLLMELMGKRFIPKTVISEYFSDEFPLILEHEYIHGIEPCFWSFSMLKDAGIHILLVEEISNKYGYHLLDSHPWNVSFNKNKPLFMDFGSFIPLNELGVFAEEFVRTIFYPLMMWKLGDSYLAQKLLFSPNGFYKRTVPMILLEDTLPIKVYTENFRKNLDKDLNEIIDKIIIEKEIEPEFLDILFHEYVLNTDWQDYQNWLFENLDDKDSHIQKPRFKRIVELVKEYSSDANSLIDLAGNAGGLAYLLSENMHYDKVFSLDYDEMAVENGYKKLRGKNSNAGIFLANFMLPCKKAIFNIAKSDVAIAAAITHHLILTQNFNIDFIFSQIAKYSQKYVYIEFMPLGLWSLYYPDIIPEIPDWYNEIWFETNFKNHFELIHKEQLERNRIMFIGQLKPKNIS